MNPVYSQCGAHVYNGPAYNGHAYNGHAYNGRIPLTFTSSVNLYNRSIQMLRSHPLGFSYACTFTTDGITDPTFFWLSKAKGQFLFETVPIDLCCTHSIVEQGRLNNLLSALVVVHTTCLYKDLRCDYESCVVRSTSASDPCCVNIDIRLADILNRTLAHFTPWNLHNILPQPPYTTFPLQGQMPTRAPAPSPSLAEEDNDAEVESVLDLSGDAETAGQPISVPTEESVTTTPPLNNTEDKAVTNSVEGTPMSVGVPLSPEEQNVNVPMSTSDGLPPIAAPSFGDELSTFSGEASDDSSQHSSQASETSNLTETEGYSDISEAEDDDEQLPSPTSGAGFLPLDAQPSSTTDPSAFVNGWL